MKIFAALASPNMFGNTSALLSAYLKGIEDADSTAEINNIFLHDKHIEYCTGCDACKSGKIKYCVIEDDMDPYYDMILEADVIIFATPVYWFNMTAQLKVFIDRLYATDYDNFPKGKKLTLLTTYADADEISSGSCHVSESIKHMSRFLNIEFVHDYGVCSAIPVVENKEIILEAEKMGQEMVMSFKR